MDELQFYRLYFADDSRLTCRFREDEVKVAIWDCDSYKSPGPDGIPLGFIKDFWQELKNDIMRLFRIFIATVAFRKK